MEDLSTHSLELSSTGTSRKFDAVEMKWNLSPIILPTWREIQLSENMRQQKLSSWFNSLQFTLLTSTVCRTLSFITPVSLFFIFFLVNLVMVIDALMKYALRFLHSVSGCVPGYQVLFCGVWVGCLGDWEVSRGERCRLILQKLPPQGHRTFFTEHCCCRVYNVIIVSKKGSVSSFWHILAEVIMSQITILNHVIEKDYQKLLTGWL